MARYRVALIGLGRIASTIDDEVQGSASILLPYAHMACYREVPAVEVVAGADPFAEQRDAFRRRWGLERLYADYGEMLDREKPDIVSVCTSAKPRPGIVADCARAGVKAIFAEKPIAFSLAEADAMIAVCKEHGAKLAVNCTRHYDASWNRVRELIDAGEIGPVLQVTAYGRSGISHNGSHLLDLVRYLAGGETSWVFGEMESDQKAAGDEDLMGNGYLAFDNGARAFVRMMPTGGAEWEVEVVGERGGFRRRMDRIEIAYWQVQSGRRPETIVREFPNPQRLQSMHLRAALDLVACLDTGREPRCTGEDGRAVLEIAIALRESHRQGGRRVDLPLADRSLAIRSSETLQGDLPVAMRRAHGR
ncbi:MAG TPA: Gfo/Idh/MocA family oxidoreductase [Chloroflexota bacterium]|jgi:predicted dehydrogenase|nr:Gfo/Idh/MocA family oxidoreductase [Chloroflexota bacterium]